jgi:hypothetical protein
MHAFYSGYSLTTIIRAKRLILPGVLSTEVSSCKGTSILDETLKDKQQLPTAKPFDYTCRI